MKKNEKKIFNFTYEDFRSVSGLSTVYSMLSVSQLYCQPNATIALLTEIIRSMFILVIEFHTSEYSTSTLTINYSI